MKPERPKAIDLFSGAGGMSLGFEQAGFDVVAALELDPVHCATHEYNFPKTRVLCADISTIDAREILKATGCRRGEIAVVFGGPPCQGFSTIGKRLADDPRNLLLFHFLRVVHELQPDYFVMENVAGLAFGHSKSVLEEFCRTAQEMGYQTAQPTQILNAANHGVPQDRRRIFVLGFRKGRAAPRYPLPTTSRITRTGELAPVAGHPDLSLASCPTVGAAIGDLPDIDDFQELRESDSVRIKPARGSKYASILQGRVEDPSDYSHRRFHDPTLLTSSARAEHTALSRRRFERTQQGETEPISRFFKLPTNGIANTLRAGTPSNRGAFTSPRPIHPKWPRCISVREAARLHSYPDWFRFHVTKWHGFRQIGNSVAPLVARAVASQIAKAVGYTPRKPSGTMKLGEETLLQLNMQSAAQRYGVSPHVIEPRVRRAE